MKAKKSDSRCKKTVIRKPKGKVYPVAKKTVVRKPKGTVKRK